MPTWLQTCILLSPNSKAYKMEALVYFGFGTVLGIVIALLATHYLETWHRKKPNKEDAIWEKEKKDLEERGNRILDKLNNIKGPFTEKERESMDLLVKAHNQFLSLKRYHASEMEEWVRAFHGCQNTLMRRVIMRDYPEVFYRQESGRSGAEVGKPCRYCGGEVEDPDGNVCVDCWQRISNT